MDTFGITSFFSDISSYGYTAGALIGAGNVWLSPSPLADEGVVVEFATGTL
jgi:hypothetical protein